MGHNVDFVDLCGAPSKIKCPECGNVINTYADDWDIDCGTDHLNNYFESTFTCSKCDNEYRFKIELSCKTYVNDKLVKDINTKCSECKELMTEDDEIEFGQCNKCCAWKYRENSK
jgi:hypothetical protein